MKRKLLLVLACVLILFLAVSCDDAMREKLFGMMDKAGENVLAPEVTANVDAVKDIVGGLTGIGATDVGLPELGEGESYTEEQINSIDKTLDGFTDPVEKKNLLDAINKVATGDKKQQDALKEEMQKPIEDPVVVKVVKNTADGAKNDVNTALAGMLGNGASADDVAALTGGTADEIKKALTNQLTNNGAAELDTMNQLVVNVVGDILGSINELADPDSEVSQADLVTAQLTTTLVTELMGVAEAAQNATDETKEEGQLVPGVDNETLLGLVGDVETLSNVGNATGANFNPLENVNLGSILGMLNIGK